MQIKIKIIFHIIILINLFIFNSSINFPFISVYIGRAQEVTRVGPMMSRKPNIKFGGNPPFP